MLFNFKTEEDNQQWVIDTEELNWARASSLVATPSIKAAESNFARFVPSEEGRLIPLGGGRYSFEGRKPFDAEGKPQLAVIIVLPVLSAENNGTCVIFAQANVAIKDLQHQPINNFVAQCMPPLKLTPRTVGQIHAVKTEENLEQERV